MSAPAAERDRIYASWLRRLETVKNELYRGFLHQDLWTSIRDEIQQRAPLADATFLVSYSQLYVAGQMALIRRLADADESSHSLASLITAIRRNPEVVTRTRYAKRWAERVGGDTYYTGERAWDENFADPGDPERVRPDLLTNDLAKLNHELEHIVTWATKTIAHLDPRKPERVPRYGELREALDLLAEITNRYQLLLEQSTSGMWTPTIQGDWQEVFRLMLFPIDNHVWGWPDPRGFT